MWADDGLDVGKVVGLEPSINHDRCHAGTCVRGYICPNCNKFTWVARTRGRWDSERRATAIPYEPVWVQLGCDCTFGDEDLAKPEKDPSETS